MAQPAHIGLVEGPQVGHAVFEHGDALDAHAEREALPLARVQSAIGQHAGMHHPRAQNFQPVGPLADLAGLAVPADIDLHRRLGEGEVAGAEAHRQVGHGEEATQEIHQAALEVRERDAAVDHQPLHLMEHRRMRCVMVGAPGAARRDDADRRLALQHGANLQRAGLGAQDDLVPLRVAAGQVEGVLVLARGVMLGDVEGREIVPVALDVGAVDDRKTHRAEDRGQLLDGAVDGVDGALPGTGRGMRARWQRHVDALGREPGVQGRRLQHRTASVERAFHGGLQRIDGRTALLARGGVHAAQRLEQRGDAARLAQRRDAHGVQRAEIRGGGDGGQGFGADRIIGGHGATSRRGGDG